MCLCILFHFCFVPFVRLAKVAKKTHLPIIQMDAITVLSTYISTCAWHTPKWLIDFIRDTMNWCKWQHPLIWAQKMTAHDLNWKPVKHKRSARVCDATTMATTAGPDLLACIMKWDVSHSAVVRWFYSLRVWLQCVSANWPKKEAATTKSDDDDDDNGCIICHDMRR